MSGDNQPAAAQREAAPPAVADPEGAVATPAEAPAMSLARSLGNQGFGAAVAGAAEGIGLPSGAVHPSLHAAFGMPGRAPTAHALLRQPAPPAAPPAAPPGGGEAETREPSAPVEGLGVRIVKGGQGADLPRPMDGEGSRVFKGDKALVRMTYTAPATENHGGLTAIVSGEGVETTIGEWRGDRAYEWELTFTRVGKVEATFEAGEPRQSFKEKFTVVADLQDFALACTEASARLDARFEAGTQKLNQAARAFRQAKEEQEADLKDVAAGEKMAEDLLFGAIFAAAGGFAGGAVGGWIKKAADGAFAKDDWLIDTAKDTAKFVVRSADRIRGGGAPTTSGDSTAPQGVDPTAKPGGSRSAGGDNPMDFLTTLAEDVAGEGSAAKTKLADLIAAARTARDANSKADFEEDPFAVVNAGVDLKNIEGLETSKAKYLKGLWKTWLGTYAWKMEFGAGGGPPGARNQVTDKIRKKIKKAADACGENADAWIDEFGLPARLKAEREADEAHWEPPIYGWP